MDGAWKPLTSAAVDGGLHSLQDNLAELGMDPERCRDGPTHVGMSGRCLRYEFKTTVPEPSAALSIPIGAAWLAGMAARKGGS